MPITTSQSPVAPRIRLLVLAFGLSCIGVLLTYRGLVSPGPRASQSLHPLAARDPVTHARHIARLTWRPSHWRILSMRAIIAPFLSMSLLPLSPKLVTVASADETNRRADSVTFQSLDCASLPMSTYLGHVLPVVNTASFCGHTKQY